MKKKAKTRRERHLAKVIAAMEVDTLNLQQDWKAVNAECGEKARLINQLQHELKDARRAVLHGNKRRWSAEIHAANAELEKTELELRELGPDSRNMEAKAVTKLDQKTYHCEVRFPENHPVSKAWNRKQTETEGTKRT